MAASSEIRFKIGADTSALSRGFVEAQSVAAVAGKQLEKKLGLKDAFKASVLALGIGVDKIAESIARSFAGMPEWAEESYRRIVAASEKSTDALRRQIASRQTALQQIKTLEDESRKESRASGMKQQTPFQEYMSQLPMVGGLIKNYQEANNVHSREEIGAAQHDEQAANQERAARTDELRNQARDQARTKDDVGASGDLARRRSAGMPGTHEGAQYLELIRQENSLRAEARDKTTSAARAEQLLLQADTLVVKQLEMAAKWREADRATAEKIETISKETGALGETTGERILRIKRDALEMDKRSHDLTRSEDDRRSFRVQSAQLMASAAKEEYEWKIGTANIEKSLRTPSGRANTTEQGILARRGTKYQSMAERARSEGRYGAAAHYGDLARADFGKFEERDRNGMKSAIGGAPDTRSAWDKKYGDELARRNSALNVKPVAPTGDKLPKNQSAGDRLQAGQLKKNEVKQLNTEEKILYLIHQDLLVINKHLGPSDLKKE